MSRHNETYRREGSYSRRSAVTSSSPGDTQTRGVADSRRFAIMNPKEFELDLTLALVYNMLNLKLIADKAGFEDLLADMCSLGQDKNRNLLLNIITCRGWEIPAWYEEGWTKQEVEDNESILALNLKYGTYGQSASANRGMLLKEHTIRTARDFLGRPDLGEHLLFPSQEDLCG